VKRGDLVEKSFPDDSSGKLFFLTTFLDVIAGKLTSMGGGIAAIPTLIATG